MGFAAGLKDHSVLLATNAYYDPRQTISLEVPLSLTTTEMTMARVPTDDCYCAAAKSSLAFTQALTTRVKKITRVLGTECNNHHWKALFCISFGAVLPLSAISSQYGPIFFARRGGEGAKIAHPPEVNGAS